MGEFRLKVDFYFKVCFLLMILWFLERKYIKDWGVGNSILKVRIFSKEF